MTLEKLLNEKINSIEREKNMEISIIKYVVEVINSDYKSFSSMYVSDSNLSDEEYLFGRVKELIKDLDNLGFDIRRTLFTDAQIKTPDIILGYTEFVDADPSHKGKKLTEKGKELVNGYRKIFGKDLLK